MKYYAIVVSLYGPEIYGPFIARAEAEKELSQSPGMETFLVSIDGPGRAEIEAYE